MEAVVHMSHFAVETVVGGLYQQQKLSPDPLFKVILLYIKISRLRWSYVHSRKSPNMGIDNENNMRFNRYKILFCVMKVFA